MKPVFSGRISDQEQNLYKRGERSYLKNKKTTKLRKAFKAEVFLSDETKKSIRFISSIMIALWNRAIDEAEKWLEKKEPKISAYSFNYWLTGIRKETFTLSDKTEVQMDSVSVDVQREVLRKLAGSYDSFFELKKKKDTRARMPKRKDPEWFQTLSWSSFKIEGKTLIVPGYGKERIHIPLTDYLNTMIESKSVVHVTLTCFDGIFKISLVTSLPAPETIENPNFIRAIDLGAGDVAVSDSDGSEFLIPTRRPDKYWMKKVAQVEARVDTCKKNSRTWKKRMGARKFMMNKESNQHISHQRKLAHALLENKVSCIVIGKPVTRLGLARSQGSAPEQHYGSQNTGYMFRLMLFIKEKASERGVRVIELADPPREGAIDNAESKFRATRSLLSHGLKQIGVEIPMPTLWTRKSFRFKQ